MTQPAAYPCDCGGTVIVTRTDSLWEFEERCDRCSHEAWMSWAHYNPPPVFKQTAQQQELFR